LYALHSTTSSTVPNWENTTRKHFFSSAGARAPAARQG
jgi:hypothetical protein